MPRYYFHAADGAPLHDNHGSNLTDDDTARTEALHYAGDLLKWSPELLSEESQLRVAVTDEKDTLLPTIVTVMVDVPKLQRVLSASAAND